VLDYFINRNKKQQVSNIILYKEDIIKILEELTIMIKPYHTSESGANILLDIETILTLLDYDVKNIFQFELMQQRILLVR